MSTIQRAYKTELDLNNRASSPPASKHAGAARWAYNWGLARKQEAYRATGKSPSAIDLHRELNALKQTDVPWMYEVSKCAPQEALRNLDTAFAHFFRRAKLKQQGKLRGQGRLSHAQDQEARAGQLPPHRLHRRLPRRDPVAAPGATAPERARLSAHRLPKSSRPPSREQAGHWYVSVLVEQEQVVPVNTGPVVGVDLGVKTLATLSDGTEDAQPAPPEAAPQEDQAAASAPSRASRKAARIAARRHSASASSIARWPISGPTRCISSPAGWRKPSQSW